MATFDAMNPELVLKQVGRAMREDGFDIADSDLSTALGSLKIVTSISEASTLELTLIDPHWVLLNSGFFGSKATDRLPAIDLNYPQTSTWWWRLVNVRVSPADGANVTLVFENRVIARLRQKRGHKTASRADMTRAEFIKSITAGELGKPKITFVSPELRDRQKIAAPSLDTRENAGSSADNKDKSPGIRKSAKLTLKGPDGGSHTLTADEIANANTILSVAERRGAGPKATKAMVEAAIVEAPFFKNNPGGHSTSRGVFQLLASTAARLGVDAMDVEACADLFLTTGFYLYGGAIKLAKENPGFSAGDIAWRVEGPREDLRWKYDAVSEAADRVIEAYGGGELFSGSGSDEDGDGERFAASYEFERGTEENPSEDSWSAGQRLAEEVGWRLFAMSNRIYYFSEPRLAAQTPTATIDPRPVGDDQAILFDGEKDRSELVAEATEARMTVICDLMDFHAGQVIELENAGPYTGRWIISETDRDTASISTDLTLIQPTSPKLEPAHELKSRSDGAAALDPDGDGLDDDGYAVGGNNSLGQPMTAKQLNGHPAPHDRVSRLARAVLEEFPELVVTATTDGNHVRNSQHFIGQAVDISGPVDVMARAAKWLVKNHRALIFQLIFNPGPSIYNGQVVNGAVVYAEVWAGHRNHIHLAVKDSATVPAPGGDRRN